MAMNEVRTILIERRDELEMELAQIGAMLDVISPREKPTPARRPRTGKHKAKKGSHTVSPKLRERILDYFHVLDHPVRVREVAKALGVSTSNTGKALKVIADDPDSTIEFLGPARGEKGRVFLYGRKDMSSAQNGGEQPGDEQKSLIQELAPAGQQ